MDGRGGTPRQLCNVTGCNNFKTMLELMEVINIFLFKQ
jgi:hypothetical protein